MSEWNYVKYDDSGKTVPAPQHDLDGKITGRRIVNLKAWFDENPEERKRLGYIKHIFTDKKNLNYDQQTQYLVRGLRWIDRYTVEDVFYPMEKSEEMLLFEELMEAVGIPDGVMQGHMFFF